MDPNSNTHFTGFMLKLSIRLRGQDTGVSPKGLEVQVGLIDRDCKVEPGQRSNPDLCAHPGRTMETRKTPLDRAKEHRLEAYATLFSRLSSDLSEPSPGAIAVHPE